MFCVICQHDVAWCECPDIEKRLAAIAAHAGWAVETCEDCGQNHARCTCKDSRA